MPSTQERHRILESENKILASVAGGAKIEDILDQIVIALEEISGDVLGSILALDQSSQQLCVLAAPNLPPAYNEAIDGLAIGDGVGSCGTAAYRGTPVVVEDILSHPFWKDFREIASSHGLRACWSVPIFSSRREVLGTFACYYKEPKLPTDLEWEVMNRLGHLAAIALERDRQQKQNQERLDLDFLIIEQAPVPVFVLTQKGQVIRSNHSASEWFQRTSADLLMSSFTDLLGTDADLDLDTLIKNAADPNYKPHVRLQTPSEGPIHVEMTISPILGERLAVYLWPLAAPVSPPDTAAILPSTDATRRLSVVVAEALSQSLTSLLSHHAMLNTHIGASDDVSALGRESMKQIGNAAEQIREIADQLKGFAGHLDLTVAPHDCDQLMSRCVLAWRKKYCSQTRFDLQLHASSNTILVDSEQLEHALSLLVEYVTDKEAFSLTLRTQDSSNEKSIRIDLRIQCPNLKRAQDPVTLFEPFQNGNSIDLHEGLGLAPIRAEIQQMRGKIEAHYPTENEIEFAIELPTDPADEVDTVQNSETIPTLPTEATGATDHQILVCEDNEAVRLAVEGLLKASGFSVHSATSGEEALDYAEKTKAKIALLVSDIRMPGIDGKELSMRLRKEDPALEIILISGHTAGIVTQEWLEEERITFLAKPFSHTDLIGAVNRSIEAYHKSSKGA